VVLPNTARTQGTTCDSFAIRVRVRAAYELSYSYNELGGKIGLKVTFNILSKFN